MWSKKCPKSETDKCVNSCPDQGQDVYVCVRVCGMFISFLRVFCGTLRPPFDDIYEWLDGLNLHLADGGRVPSPLTDDYVLRSAQPPPIMDDPNSPSICTEEVIATDFEKRLSL